MANNNSGFLIRADQHIALANDQMDETTTQGEVSASLMYAARFNAWMASTSFESKEAMQEEKAKILEYFTEQYKLALSENIDNHIESYDFSKNDIK